MCERKSPLKLQRAVGKVYWPMQLHDPYSVPTGDNLSDVLKQSICMLVDYTPRLRTSREYPNLICRPNSVLNI